MFVSEGERPKPADERALDFLRRYDINFVRIPTNYRVWTTGFDYTHPDESVLESLDGHLRACLERGIHVALNLHHVPGYCITPDPTEIHNLTPRYIDTLYFPPEAAAEVGVKYLRAHPETTAVFCANDAVAIALLVMARQAGISVPEQLSVVGFDDIDLAGFVSPALTTMAVDKVGMGRIAVTLLAHRLDLGQTCVTQTLVRPTLVERETTRTLEPVVRRTDAAPVLRVETLPA
jgi:DNA-binding LacI/PurR family transcriptional regulator